MTTTEITEKIDSAHSSSHRASKVIVSDDDDRLGDRQLDKEGIVLCPTTKRYKLIFPIQWESNNVTNRLLPSVVLALGRW